MVYYFENRVTNYVGYLASLEKNMKSIGWPFLICLAKEMQRVYLSTDETAVRRCRDANATEKIEYSIN